MSEIRAGPISRINERLTVTTEDDVQSCVKHGSNISDGAAVGFANRQCCTLDGA